jgi:hypothetical protein
MRNGDLSNRTGPRIVVVWEDLIASVPDDRLEQFEKYCNKGKWREAIGCYRLNELMSMKLLYLVLTKNINVTIVTWLPEEAVIHLSDRLDEENLPIRGVFASSPKQLATDLAYNPDIICVYDPHDATFYGSKGATANRAADIGRML